MLGNCGGIPQAAEAVGMELEAAVPRIELLRHRIIDMKRKLLTLADVTPNRTLLEVARIAYADARDAFDEKGNLLKPSEWDDDTAAAISGLDQEVRFEGRGEDKEMVRVAKVRKHDKMGALNFLGRQQKLIGGEGDGVNELANALADRLNAQRKPPERLRAPVQMVEEVLPTDNTPMAEMSAEELAS